MMVYRSFVYEFMGEILNMLMFGCEIEVLFDVVIELILDMLFLLIEYVLVF